MKFAIVLFALFSASFAATTVQQFVNDNNVLNYALTLENFEAALYEAGYNYTDNDFVPLGYPNGTAAAIKFIGVQERTHAIQLTSYLALRGWPSVPPCTNYNFPDISTADKYLRTLAFVEGVGTSAYDGAAGAITDKTVLGIAAGIATVEARHTALLNYILNNGSNNSVFPTNQTAPYTFDAVVNMVGSFLRGCPSNTTNTSYNGTVTVQSNVTSSYRWVLANTFRPSQGNNDVQFYATNANAANIDLAVLQYALTLENLEATFYAQFANLYNTTNVLAAMVTPNPSIAAIISANFAIIAAHEAQHVSFFKGIISTFSSGKAVGNAACSYNFSVAPLNLNSSSNFTSFLFASQYLENTGVAAYVGAIKYIVDNNAAGVAATIATVEAEHAAYVANLYTNINSSFTNQPFPNTSTPVYVVPIIADAGVPPATIYSAVASFIVPGSCPITNVNFIGNITGNPVDFFNDQNQAPLTPFVTSSPTSTAVIPGPNPTTSTTKQGGNSGALVASFAVVAAVIAAML